jgi:hypothetical protein
MPRGCNRMGRRDGRTYAAIWRIRSSAARQMPMLSSEGRELGQLCTAALATGPKDTRELAAYVIREGNCVVDKYDS